MNLLLYYSGFQLVKCNTTAEKRLFQCLFDGVASFVAQDFYDAGVLGPDVHSVGFEVVEVGAGGSVLGGGVPPVIVCGYVAVVVDLVAAAVVYGELVIFEAVVFYQAADDEAVVVAVAVGGDEVGELEGGVVYVTVDVDSIVDDAVTANQMAVVFCAMLLQT